jgi:hypothetical protein
VSCTVNSGFLRLAGLRRPAAVEQFLLGEHGDLSGCGSRLRRFSSLERSPEAVRSFKLDIG